MSYIKFRKQLGGIIAYIAIPPVLIFSMIFGNILYTVGIIFIGLILFSLMESLLAKCPKCQNKPIPFLGEIPAKCPYCANSFVD